jgi:hypothetical protein
LETLGSISEENMKQDMPVTSDGNLKKHIREEHDAQFIQFKYYLCRIYHCETCGIKFSVREKLDKHRHENMMDGMLKMWDM